MRNSQMTTRLHAMLEEALGPVVRDALAVPGTKEVLVNADGRIWHEVHGTDTVCIGTQDPRETEAVIRLAATLNGKTTHAGKPSLAAVLPGGQRFQGFVPPRTEAPSYCIRVHHARVLTREDYVPAVCPGWVWDLLAQAITAGMNLLVVGGMGSGKTTLLNALVRLIPPHLRVVSAEDTAESSLSVPNYLQLYSSEDGGLQEVAKEAFRTAARRILVGEIRDGATAVETLNLWLAIGGGMATTHADSARDALPRLAYLCSKEHPDHYHPMLGQVIDWIVFMEADEGGCRMSEVLKISGWKEGHYEEEMVFDRRTAVAA